MLSISTYENRKAVALDLRWSPDEAAFLDPHPSQVFRALSAKGEAEDYWAEASDYAVTDPYGGARIAAALSARCKAPLAPPDVFVGAGITGLLFSLSQLSRHLVCTSPYAYPDLAHWVVRQGGRVAFWDILDRSQALPALPDGFLVQIDNPGVEGFMVAKDRLLEICEQVERAGGWVILDEANANYRPGMDSFISVLPHTRNAIVLRSLSKGYCAGGLRVGIAVCSPMLADKLRAHLPPMGAAALSLRIAAWLLQQEDMFAPLAARLAVVRPAFLRALGASNIPGCQSEPCFPWVATVDPGGERVRRLMEMGIGAKQVDSVVDASLPRLLKIALPLSADRFDSAMSLLSPQAALDGAL